MKSYQLRIGNLVQINNLKSRPKESNKPFCIVKIDNEQDSISGYVLEDLPYGETFGQLLNKIEPILITEEWLIKLGFTKMTDTTPYNYRIFKSKMLYYIRYGTFSKGDHINMFEGWNGLFIGNKFVRTIMYIHELQNLHFAITGEELTLKKEPK